MKLIFAYIRSFKNIREQEFVLSDDYEVTFAKNRLHIKQTELADIKEYLYKGNLIKDLHLIVGRTGAGKTNFLQLIGMEYRERRFSSQTDAYFLLYKGEGKEQFCVELFNIYIPQLTRAFSVSRTAGNLNNGCFCFSYDYNSGKISDASRIGQDDLEDTAIVNTFDRNAFANYPYHDIIEPMSGQWISRKVTSYDDIYPAKVVNAAGEYIKQMPEDNVKRRASFVINRENWQYRINVELPYTLLEKEYWLYGEKRQDGIIKSLSDIPFASLSTGKLRKGRTDSKVSAKEMFLHDLMTDYAIYLRKIAISVTELSEHLSSRRPLIKQDGIENPTVLPDGAEDISLESRLSWLGQYIDYHTDEINGNKGLVWQETKEIRDSIDILRQFDDSYFTEDTFSYPIVKISETDERFIALFEMMGQYHRDQYNVFPKEFLPYKLTYLSSGEFQYAKIWGALEEAIETKMGIGNKAGLPQEMRPLQLIVLMDEPETYLHPEYCREFISKTVDILKRRNPSLQLQLIVSTHSPFMLSDTLTSQVTRIDYDEEDGRCIVLEPSSKQYFAANIFSIMSDGFFLDYTIGEYARGFLEEKYQFLKRLLNNSSTISVADLEEIGKIQRLLPYIGDEMIRHSFELIINHLQNAEVQFSKY